jgi:hypothetical protein
MGREAAYTGQKIAWKDDSEPAAGDKKEKASGRIALAMMSSKQDLAPDNLQFGDKFEPSPMPIPGMTKFA